MNIPDLLSGSPPMEAASSSSTTATTTNFAGSIFNNVNAINNDDATKRNNSPNDGSRSGVGVGARGTKAWNFMGEVAGSLVHSARDVVHHAAASVGSKGEVGSSAAASSASHDVTMSRKSEKSTTSADNQNDESKSNQSPRDSPAASAGIFASLAADVSSFAASSSVTNFQTNIQNNLTSFTKSMPHIITGKNSLPDKTTASQVLMFRQLLHTKCRPGLRLSRGYEGTAAQKAVLHMPWWERGIQQSGKMIISYDNLITRLWLSGAIMPFEKGGYANQSHFDGNGGNDGGAVDTLINERGLPPIPHRYWIERLGFQQDDPVTDFRSGGVLSLAMLVHIAESCPSVHSRFVPKRRKYTEISKNDGEVDNEIRIDDILEADASVLPFGITCINVTDMLAKFLLFSKSIDKMDALLSAKPFWRMFIDPNAMLVLQEVSLDLLCDIVVEMGRERRYGLQKKDDAGLRGAEDGKVTVFDFAQIMERTEKRVGDEVLGAGPQTVNELRAVAHRVKSKYLMRIQLKEKHLAKQSTSNSNSSSVNNNVTATVGGIVNLLKSSRGLGTSTCIGSEKDDAVSSKTARKDPDAKNNNSGCQSVGDTTKEAVEIEIDNGKESLLQLQPVANSNDQTTVQASGEGDVSAIAEAFDLLGEDFPTLEPTEELDAMDVKLDPAAAFTIDDDF